MPTQRPTTAPTTPPIVTPETVYHTATGSRFHLTPDCGQTRGAKPDTWAHSVEAGFKPCPNCVGKEYPAAVAELNGTSAQALEQPTPTFVPDPTNKPTPEPTQAPTQQPTTTPTATPIPAAHPDTVYHTATGSRFHLTANCGQTRGAKPADEDRVLFVTSV